MNASQSSTVGVCFQQIWNTSQMMDSMVMILEMAQQLMEYFMNVPRVQVVDHSMTADPRITVHYLIFFSRTLMILQSIENLVLVNPFRSTSFMVQLRIEQRQALPSHKLEQRLCHLDTRQWILVVMNWILDHQIHLFLVSVGLVVPGSRMFRQQARYRLKSQQAHHP